MPTPEELEAQRRKAVDDAVAAANAAAEDARKAAAKIEADAKVAREAAAREAREAAAREAREAAAREAADAAKKGDAAVSADDEPPEWKGLPAGVIRELRESRKKAAKEREAREQAEAQSRTELADLKRRLEAQERAAAVREADDQILDAYPRAPALRDPAVRDGLRATYEAYRASVPAGDAVLPIGAWLRTDAVTKHPLYRLAIAESAEDPGVTVDRARGTAATARTAVRAPEVGRGAGASGAAGTGKLTPQQIVDISRDRRAFAANQDAIRDQLAETYPELRRKPPVT